MGDIHPTETASDGKFRPRNTTYAPGDRIVELIGCAQCGLPFREKYDAEGESMDTPGITENSLVVSVNNQENKLPVHLRGGGGSKTLILLDVSYTGGTLALTGLDAPQPISNLFTALDSTDPSNPISYDLVYSYNLSHDSLPADTLRLLFLCETIGPNKPVIGTVLTSAGYGLTVVSNVAPDSLGSSITNPFLQSSATVSDPQVGTGCRFCGSLNPRAKGRRQDFDYAYKNMEGR